MGKAKGYLMIIVGAMFALGALVMSFPFTFAYGWYGLIGTGLIAGIGIAALISGIKRLQTPLRSYN